MLLCLRAYAIFNNGDGNRSWRVVNKKSRTAQLLSRSMEILCNDQIYQEALSMAAKIIDRSPSVSD